MLTNPFAELSASIPPSVMQAYILVMILLVAAGTLFDIFHKKSAQYFFNNWRNAQNKGPQTLSSGEMASLAAQTAASEILTSSEFCNPAAHLLTMYGFLAYVIATFVMVFWYPTPDTAAPAIWPLLWYLGVLMVCGGGYWFWFFIAVPRREGRSLHPVAARQRDPGPGLGHRGDEPVPRLVPHRHDGAVRVGPLVQVLAHVFQARGGLSEAGGKRERLQEQPAGPRRQARGIRQRAPAAPSLLGPQTSVIDTGDNRIPCRHSFI
jgi:hypothetical protein